MIFERHKSEFKKPGWTRVQVTHTRRDPFGIRRIIHWVKNSYPNSRYYYSYHTSAYWFEDPKAVTEFIMLFVDNIVKVSVIEDTTYSPVEKCQGQTIIPDLFQP